MWQLAKHGASSYLYSFLGYLNNMFFLIKHSSGQAKRAVNQGKILLPESIRWGFVSRNNNKTIIYRLINAYRLPIANRCGKLHAAFRGVYMQRK